MSSPAVQYSRGVDQASPEIHRVYLDREPINAEHKAALDFVTELSCKRHHDSENTHRTEFDTECRSIHDNEALMDDFAIDCLRFYNTTRSSDGETENDHYLATDFPELAYSSFKHIDDGDETLKRLRNASVSNRHTIKSPNTTTPMAKLLTLQITISADKHRNNEAKNTAAILRKCLTRATTCFGLKEKQNEKQC